MTISGRTASLSPFSIFEDIFLEVEKNLMIAIIEIDENHKITRFNPAATQLFGVTEQQSLNNSIAMLIPEKSPNEHKTNTFNEFILKQQQSKYLELTGLHSNGKSIDVQVKIIQYIRQDQAMSLLLIEDRSEINCIREQQREQSQRFKAVADLAPVGILQTNSQWEATYANNRWCDICKTNQSDILGHNWISVFHRDDVTTCLAELRDAMNSGDEYAGKYRFYSKYGEIIWVELLARPITNAKGETEGFLATLVDSTYRHITEEKLRIAAEWDSLTTLVNRTVFFNRLNIALPNTQKHQMLALLYLDLDGFKTINDTLGHDAGDQLLVAVARRLESCVRKEDTVARLGGDEFSILLHALHTPDIAATIASKVLAVLEKPFMLQDQEVFISTSIGIALSKTTADESKNESDNESESLMKQADIALYRAKAAGRNNFQYFSEELELATKLRMDISNKLHRALERKEFEVFYQLQADIFTSCIIGTEALLRWHHPERGLLAPHEFIHILEETGLILPVSRWLWSKAFAQHKRWVELGLVSEKGHISINLSRRQLRDETIVTQLFTAIASANLQPSQVLVEITETALIEDSDFTLGVLNQFRQNGIQIALDDFGTGFSSLTYLKKFPIHIVKIDQSFIRDLLTDKDDAAITHAVVDLAHTLDLIVIAEGVDQLEKRQQLALWGCDQFQGYILNKPSDGQSVEQLMYDNRAKELMSNTREC